MSELNTNSLISTQSIEPFDLKGSQILCATCVPETTSLVAATYAGELISSDKASVTIESEIRGIASVRYQRFLQDSLLPEETALILALSKGIGLRLYKFPGLEQVVGSLATELEDLSKNAQAFSVDSLGSDLVNESFRVALVEDNSVVLLDVHPTREKVTILGQCSVEEKVVSVAFSEMTIVASTIQTHYLLRISRGGRLAVSAAVQRFDKPQRNTAAAAVGEGGAAMLSFFGGLFVRKNATGTLPPTLAFALPDNKWLLLVDGELITFSSYGAKIDEMENVFKSRVGMNIEEPADNPRTDENPQKRRESTRRNNSMSSLNSAGTGVTHMTFLDETQAPRSEKPPVATAFSSPFVLSVSETNELLAFAANGSVPGVIEHLSLLDEDEKRQGPVKLLASRVDRTLAIAYWPSGKAVSIELTDNLETLVEQKEAENELRLALALVPADQIEQMITLRRKLASEARDQEWHDAAIQHMDSIVILSVKREGVDQVDLVSEAVELRGPRGSGWDSDRNVATLWADFLFKLRRRVMRPSKADVDVLETLCRADESATRIKKLFSAKHEVSLSAGSALITSRDCKLQEADREEALVALYTSLAEHDKALVLLENSKTNNAFDSVVGYLSTNMRASDDHVTFFTHLKWLAHNSREQAQGERKLKQVVMKAISNASSSEYILQQLFEVLVVESEGLLDEVIEELSKRTEQSNEGDEANGISSDAFAAALLSGMAKADALKKRELFSSLREDFGSLILYKPDANYHSYTLLQALQTPEIKDLGLHEELAYLLGRQGRHELAADELAAESNLASDKAMARLRKTLPLSEQANVGESLAAAYLRVSAKGRAMRVEDASQLVRYGAGTFDVEKLLLDGRCSDDSLTLSEMRPLLTAALVAGSERLRIAEILRSLRKSEVRRLREKVMMQRRRFVIIGHDRACTLCTRRIADSSFAAYPDGSVAHMTCHTSKESR